ncbi:hypothetical protein Tco_1118058, partial [Tanacetum coccineum]
IDLFAFIRYSDPTKVWIGDRDLADMEVKLLKMTEGRIVSLDPLVTTASGDSEETIAKDVLEVAVEKTKKFKRKRKTTGDASASTFPPKKLREDYHVATSITDWKSLATICSLIQEGSSVSSGIAKPQDDGLTDSMSELDLRTCPPSKRYVISSDDSHYLDSRSEVNFFARSAVVDTPVMTSAITTTAAIDASVVQVSKDKVRSSNLETFRDSTSAGGANVNAASSLKLNEPTTSSDSFYASQDLDFKTLHNIYTVLPHLYFFPMRSMDYDQLYVEFNIGVARQMCLGAEVRMRVKHMLEQKDRLKDKCAEQTTLLLEKDAEITHLRSLLSLKETEAAEAIRLHSQLSIVEAANAAKSTELRDLKERNFMLEGEKDALSEKVVTLESMTTSKETELASLTAQDSLAVQKSLLASAFELFKDCIEAMHDEQEKILTHGLKLVLLKFLQSLEYCYALGQAICCVVNKGIHDGLRERVDHGKSGRDLAIIKAYDPSAEAKYIDVVNTLGIVDFSLLFELKSKKDASIIDLMDSLRLEGPLAEIPEAEDLQPSLEQLRLPIHRPEDNIGEIIKKHLSLTDVMVPIAEPLSTQSLIGEASTSAVLVAAEPVTTLSTTLASSSVIHPLSVSDYRVLDAEPHHETPYRDS